MSTSKRFAKRMMISGAVVVVLSYILTMISLWNVYGIAGASGADSSNGTTSLAIWQVVVKTNLVLNTLGYITVAAGVVIYIFDRIRNRHK